MHRRIARIHGPKRGTGFLLSPDLVLTCAHIVEDVDLAAVDLPLHDDRPVRTGTVEHHGRWDPGHPEDDVAVLRLDEPVPIEGAMLAPAGTGGIGRGELTVIGFPDRGDWEATDVRADFDDGFVGQIRPTPGSNPLREGYSGAMVFAGLDPPGA